MSLEDRAPYWVGRRILSRRIKEIKSGNIYGPSVHWTLNIKLRGWVFTCHSAWVAHSHVSGWCEGGRPAEFLFIRECLSCCTGQNRRGNRKLKCKIDEEIVSEHIDAISPLNGSEMFMHSTKKF